MTEENQLSVGRIKQVANDRGKSADCWQNKVGKSADCWQNKVGKSADCWKNKVGS